MRFHSFITRSFRELRRRKVFQVASLYLVVAWGASLGAADLLPAFGVPDWGVRMFVTVALLGFPIAVALAWAYEVSAEGITVDRAGSEGGFGGSQATTRLAPEGASIRVTWESDGSRHQQAFANAFTIGRDVGCELRLDHVMVSRRHARVWVDGGVWQIEDLGSRNGTRLDGKLIARAELPAASEVQLYPDGPRLRVEVMTNAGAAEATLS